MMPCLCAAETGRDLGSDVECLGEGQRPFRQPLRERLALQVLHHQVVDRD